MQRQPVVSQGLLDTRAPIPFPEAQITIYQPSIKEIEMSGAESSFLMGANALSKNYSNIEDKINPSQASNFDILMTIIQEKTDKGKQISDAIKQVLYLLFPEYHIMFTNSIILQENNGNKAIHILDNSNFEKFGQIIYDVFCLAEFTNAADNEYNPVGERARAIAEKLQKRKALLAEIEKERNRYSEMESIFCRYIDILAVGEGKDKNTLSNYSVFQLIEEFKRFNLKQAFEYTIQAKLAGATGIKDAKDWQATAVFGDHNNDDD